MKQFGTLIISLILSVGVAISANSAISSQIRALEQQGKIDLQSLNQQMADLKQKHQSETTPLQQQMASFNNAFDSAMKQLHSEYDDTRNRDNDERAALMDRIKPGYLALYNDKKASLASVNTREDEAGQSLRQQEEAELQSIREKYDAQRKSLQQESAAQRQAIDSQFDAAVKGLK